MQYVDGVTYEIAEKSNQSPEIRLDQLDIVLQVLSFKDLRNGKDHNDDLEFTIDGTLWKDIPLFALPTPERTLFQREMIRNFRDGAKVVSTDFIFDRIREGLGVRVAYDNATGIGHMQAATKGRFVFNMEGLLWQ